MKRGWTFLVVLALLVAAACQESKPPAAETISENSTNVVTYRRGDLPKGESAAGVWYRGTISVGGQEGQVDTRPLILCIEDGEVRVWINGEIYPTALTLSTRSTIQVNVLLAEDEVMSLAGDYLKEGRIKGKVVRESGGSGVFEVSMR